MNDELNLLTQEEKFEQQTSLIFRILNIIFISIFIVTLGFSIYSYLELSKLLKIEEELKSSKNNLLTQISAFSSIEATLIDTIRMYKI